VEVEDEVRLEDAVDDVDRRWSSANVWRALNGSGGGDEVVVDGVMDGAAAEAEKM